MKRKLFSMVQNLLMKQGYCLTYDMKYLGRERSIDISDRMDIVRISSLELVAYEIHSKNIEGNVAELGVYRGHFAEKINQIFSDRKLYLFDTFEGFDMRDVTTDKMHGFSSGRQDYSKTSVDFVLTKLKYPQNCIVRKGYFPESVSGLNDIFSFVSIDVDLYKPMYDGLDYFYPRLARGGYIFVHDYNNSRYPGVRVAVRNYCSKNDIGYFPLCDVSGSVILSKQN